MSALRFWTCTQYLGGEDVIYGCRRGMYKHGHNLDPSFHNVALTELITQIKFPGSSASWWKPFEVFEPHGTVCPQEKT